MTDREIPPIPVLVTGGGGFIGRRLVRALLDQGHPVTVLDAMLPGIHGEVAEAPDETRGCRFIRGDVRDEETLRDALAGAELVYHLAAETGTGESMYRARRYVDVNVGGTASLAELAADMGVRRVVLASSRAVYGEGPYTCPRCGTVAPRPREAERLAAGLWEPVCPSCGGEVRPEASRFGVATRPSSVYGLTKRDQEELLDQLLRPRGVEVAALRLQNVYGPGQSLSNPYTGILSIFSVLLLGGERVRVFEDGLESRDFVWVDDVVDAFLRAGMEPSAAGRTLDVGSGRRVTVLELAEALAGRLSAGGPAPKVSGEYRLGDVRHAVADITGAREVLGWHPRTTLEDGLDRFANWVEGCERPQSTLPTAIEEMRGAGMLGRVGGVVS